MAGASRERLFFVTVGYLLAPNLIFLAGWLAPRWGIPATTLGLVCLADVWRRARTDVPPPAPRQWAFVAVFALALTVLAGIGGVNVQVTDYLKHDLVFHDLAVHPWPVVYRHGGAGGSMLCYYIAYYLPPGLAGKLLGVSWIAPASLAWGLTGVTLAFAWIARFGRPHSRTVLVAFTLVDGFAWLPGLYPFARRLLGIAGETGGEWWASANFAERFATFGTPPMHLLFESVPTQLLWVPQHAIVAWLATACVLRVLLDGGSPRHLGLVLGATLLWSPFVTVGLVPLAIAALRGKARGAFTWPGVMGGLAFGGPVVPYILAHARYQYVGFFPARLSGAQDWLRFALFLVLSVGILAAAVTVVRRHFAIPHRPEWVLFVTSSVWLVATTLVFMGYYNDWVMRVSMPALMVFRLVVARLAVGLWRKGGRLAPRLGFAAVVLLSAERPLKVYVLAPFGKVGQQTFHATIPEVACEVPTLVQLPGSPAFDYSDQYLGTRQSWFGRHLLRRHATVEEPPP
jgi:hypothetical protein